jgi:hypothetical protein
MAKFVSSKRVLGQIWQQHSKACDSHLKEYFIVQHQSSCQTRLCPRFSEKMAHSKLADVRFGLFGR